MAEWGYEGMNQGDDLEGIVHTVGSNVTEFKPGDPVAAFHPILNQAGRMR